LKVRWSGEIELRPALYGLLTVILSAGSKPIPFSDLDMPKGGGEKAIRNQVYDLNLALEEIKWPHTNRTKSAHIICDQ